MWAEVRVPKGRQGSNGISPMGRGWRGSGGRGFRRRRALANRLTTTFKKALGFCIHEWVAVPDDPLQNVAWMGTKVCATRSGQNAALPAGVASFIGILAVACCLYSLRKLRWCPSRGRFSCARSVGDTLPRCDLVERGPLTTGSRSEPLTSCNSQVNRNV